MKKLIIALSLLMVAITSQAQIKELKIDNNYLVITDTVTSAIEFEFPAADIVYSIQGPYCYISKISGGGTLYSFTTSKSVNTSDVVFTNETLRTFFRTNTGFSLAGASASSTGWGVYTDGVYTTGSPLSLVGAAAYINLPNNAASSLETQKPPDVDTFYDGTVITGRFGDGINITISFAVRPTTAQVTRVTVVPDIGGAVGEITDYERDIVFSKGSGVVQRYLSSYNAYTYDTWEANGAQLKIKADQNCEVFGIRYLITRTHKAR